MHVSFAYHLLADMGNMWAQLLFYTHLGRGIGHLIDWSMSKMCKILICALEIESLCQEEDDQMVGK